jgi:hypothetical protein
MRGQLIFLKSREEPSAMALLPPGSVQFNYHLIAFMRKEKEKKNRQKANIK